MTRILPLLLALVSGGLACARERAPEGAREDAARDLRSSTAVVDLDGRPRVLAQPDGRADLLVFVRSDCPISNRYAPKLGRIAERFADAPVDVYLVYVDVDETPARIREHVEAYALPGTPLRDPRQELALRAEIAVTPEAALFDGGGRLRYHGRIDDGWADYGKPRATPTTDELVDAVTAVLAGGEPPVTHAAAVGCPLPPRPETLPETTP